MNLKDDKQQNIQIELDFSSALTGEAREAGREETESSGAMNGTENPASTNRLMEEVCERENLKAAMRRVRANRGSPGVDGITVIGIKDYLKQHGPAIREQLLNGTYEPQPVRRVEIDKPDGGVRKLGIPTVLDRLIQQAVMQVLQRKWDRTFSDHSYGFRPGRSAHQAVAQAQQYIAEGRGWCVDLDLEKFFDNLSHEWAIQFVEHRVADCRVLRLIQKWLKAGVSEDGQWSESKVGTPQGAVVSPLLANVYLHYVFDLWIEAWRKKVARGVVIVVRYADDLVVGFESRAEAERFLEEFRERLAKFGLELHAEKTRLIEFGRFAEQNRKRRGEGKPETFTFLGFTHYCGKRRSDGSFIVWRKTASKRMVAKLRSLKAALIRRKHDPPAQVGEWLRKVVQGYYQYHAVPGNLNQLSAFRHRLCRLWRAVLNRRSQRGERPWQRLNLLLERWIPFPRVLHPYPQARFAARHPR